MVTGIVAAFHIPDNADIMLRTTNGRALVFSTALMLPKTTRDTIGVQVMTMKARGAVLEKAFLLSAEQSQQLAKYRSKNIPAAGSFAKDIPDPDQMTML